MKYQFLFILLFIVSCKRSPDNLEIDSDLIVKNQFVTGTISDQDTIVDKFAFLDCFCNLTDSGVVISHVNRGGFVGESLITHVNNNAVNFQLETWSDYGRPPKYHIQNRHLIMNKGIFNLGETLEGQIEISGYRIAPDNNDQKANFTVAGTFKCVLRDSSYTYATFEADLIRRLINEELNKLKWIAQNKPDSIIELNLNERFLKTIPKEIGQFSKLTRLNLHGNELNKIDVEFLKNLPNLKEIDLSRNGIKEIPEGISKLEHIEVLNLSANPIKRIPNSLYGMKQLRDLNLGATDIAELSREIKNLDNLTRLHIGYIDIERIPVDLFALSKLEQLNLPDSIVPFRLRGLNLESLKELDCSYDFLIYNKSDLSILRNLNTLHISFFYRTDEEARNKSYDGEQFLKKLLPTVDIYVTTYVSPE